MSTTKGVPSKLDSNYHPIVTITTIIALIVILTKTVRNLKHHPSTKQHLIQQPQPIVSLPTTGAPTTNHTPSQVKQS